MEHPAAAVQEVTGDFVELVHVDQGYMGAAPRKAAVAGVHRRSG